MERDADTAVQSAAQSAASLVAAMPRLVLEARRIAATVYHGVHGRRRAGAGENFWQYRRFVDGEPSNRVDWRRSARDDHLYVREREWEAAHTVWIWPDLSPSMVFASPLARETKRDRALVVAFALADLLVRGGERVGIPGVMRPSASRNIVEKMAESLVHAASLPDSLPPSFSPSPLAEVVVLGDLWSPTPEVVASLVSLSASGAHGHVVQVCDPVEETFPYTGRVEFREPESGTRLTIGRAETLREDYVARVDLHRTAIRREAERHNWTFLIHRTDRPATELLLALHARMSGGAPQPAVRAPDDAPSEREPA
ncbi:DUF58 domain-containing protein [Ancylobacter sp. 6x-1]|uniref:DUF58 domain-containing protein n=1 Tax=Ancylobacter crimeensis TaxID=2579147 RepID=A0ABT0D9N7_9HYPH|nr:DUF58 domain-containing protein [Ancylobacter crimeensis]MCK0196655.1 DUF58 domain-containing protein [Ancylobacter crimeensis]